VSAEPYVCPAGHASYSDNGHRYCPACKAFEADDPVLVQELIDRVLVSHKANVALPRQQLLRVLRILQHRLDRDTRLDREDAAMTEVGWPSAQEVQHG
jgi:hypothetical protein